MSGHAATPVLPGLLSAIYRHRQRLDAYHIRPGTPRPRTTRQTPTTPDTTRSGRPARRGRQSHDRQPPAEPHRPPGTGNRLVGHQGRPASRQRRAHHSGRRSAAGDLDYAARQALEAADACHALRLSLTRADYASPADYDRLDALTRAAHRHAARLGAARDTGLGPGAGRRAGRARRDRPSPDESRRATKNSPLPAIPPTRRHRAGHRT